MQNGKINLAKIIHPLDLEKVAVMIKTSLDKGVNYQLEYRIFTKNNQEKWIGERGKGIFDSDDSLLAIEGIVTDISDRKTMEKQLSQARDKYLTVLENALEGIFQTTIYGYYLSVNKALAKIYGYDRPSDLIKRLNNNHNGLYVESGQKQKLIDLLKSQDIITNFESQVYNQDRNIIWISENARAVKDIDGDFLYYEGMVEDITNYKKAQEKLYYQAFYDQLTNLPNRQLFTQHLHRSLNKLKTDSTSHYQFSVLFLDCDRFKAVNDSLGHNIGDSLLVAIGERLKSCVGEKDILARLGGDEFTILCNDVENVKDVIQMVENIKTAFQECFMINEYQIFSAVSIGIFFSSSLDSDEYKKLTEAKILQYADNALYKAKSKKRGYYQIFQGDMHNEALANLQLENEIRQGLKEEEFLLYYQPIINLNNKKIKGFESLIRWNHPQKGLTSPYYFINLAEKTGLIIPISYWVLEEGCRQLKQWHDQINNNNNLFSGKLPTLNINLSSQEFSSENFLSELDRIIAQTQVAPEYLRLEITENSSIFQHEFILEILQEIVARKIQLWVDDFGTGYSNLSYLHKLPIHGLKIDCYFVKEIEINFTKAKMIKGILSLAKDLDLEVVIEGIETEKQLEIIQQMGGEFAQGYLFSQPVANTKAFDLLR